MQQPNMVVKALQATGLMAQLRSDLPVQELLEIGDALLAAPLLVVAISLEMPDALAAIAEFDRRYGQNLVVGAAQVTSLAAARSAMWAGARFIITPGVDDALVHFAQRYGLFCLPQLTNLRELQQFGQRDLELALIAPQVTPLLAATPIDPRRTVAVITAEPALVDAAQLGVTALACGDLLFPTPQWSHAQIITQARRLRTRWSQLVLGQLKV